MRNFPRFNFDSFEWAATLLRSRGWQVVSPAEMDLELGFDPELTVSVDRAFVQKAMRRDLRVLLDKYTSAVHLLPGWTRSQGAQLECKVAQAIGLHVYFPGQWWEPPSHG